MAWADSRALARSSALACNASFAPEVASASRPHKSISQLALAVKARLLLGFCTPAGVVRVGLALRVADSPADSVG